MMFTWTVHYCTSILRKGNDVYLDCVLQHLYFQIGGDVFLECTLLNLYTQGGGWCLPWLYTTEPLYTGKGFISTLTIHYWTLYTQGRGWCLPWLYTTEPIYAGMGVMFTLTIYYWTSIGREGGDVDLDYILLNLYMRVGGYVYFDYSLLSLYTQGRGWCLPWLYTNEPLCSGEGVMSTLTIHYWTSIRREGVDV